MSAYTFDKLLELRAAGQAAITSTTAETGVAFACEKQDEIKAVIAVESFDNTTADEAYLIEIGVCDTVGGTYVVVASLASAVLKGKTAPYTFELPISGKQMSDAKSGAAFIQAKATLGGTTPILKYACYLAKA